MIRLPIFSSNFEARYSDAPSAASASAKKNVDLVEEGFRDTDFVMSFFRHNRDNEFYITTQFMHDRKLGEPLADFHLHLVPCADPAAPQQIYFRASYVWVGIGGSIPAIADWTTVYASGIISPGDVYKHRYMDLFTDIAPPIVESYSSILLTKVTRLGTDDGDTYDTGKDHGTAAANLAVLSFDSHYLKDRLGSTYEYWD